MITTELKFNDDSSIVLNPEIRKMWIKDLEEIHNIENKKWFSSTTYSKVIIPDSIEENIAEEYIFKTKYKSALIPLIVFIPFLLNMNLYVIGIAIFFTFFILSNYYKLKKEDWRFSISQKCFKVKKENVVSEILFENVFFLTFCTIRKRRDTTTYLYIYHYTGSNTTYLLTEIECSDLIDDENNMREEIGKFYGKYLNSIPS